MNTKENMEKKKNVKNIQLNKKEKVINIKIGNYFLDFI